MLVLTGMFMEMKPETMAMALPAMILLEVIIPTPVRRGVGDNFGAISFAQRPKDGGFSPTDITFYGSGMKQ